MPLDAGDLYRQYAPELRRYLAARIDADAVDDLLHDTFERVVRDLPAYEDRGYPLRAWLYRIAQARLIDLIRYRRRRVALPFAGWFAVVDGPEDAVLQRDEGVWLRAQLRAHLTDKQRAVIWLRFVEDLNLAETGKRLGISVGQVKALQWRAVARLKIAFAPDAVAQEARPRSCTVGGCERPVHCRSMCRGHYQRWMRRR